MLITDHHAAWHAQYAAERERLLAALKSLGDGGPIEDVQHIGATSVPGLPAQACIDIALSVWPFPLEAAALETLAQLGYAPVTTAPEQRWQRADSQYQLWIVEAGSPPWLDFQLLRDYSRHTPAARDEYALGKALNFEDAHAYERYKADWQQRHLPAARSWWIAHNGFTPVQRVAQELAGCTGTWYIASGWALDLFLGRVTRVHHDVDVVVARAQQLVVRDYLAERGWKLITPYEQRLEPWPPHMTLELPRHQAHAHRDGDFIDILLTDIEAGVWRYRRDPAIVRTLERVSRHDNGLPYLAPELSLLFKSKNTSNKPRPQDQADFEAVCAHLQPEPRAWLRWALTACDPAHPWIEQLA